MEEWHCCLLDRGGADGGPSPGPARILSLPLRPSADLPQPLSMPVGALEEAFRSRLVPSDDSVAFHLGEDAHLLKCRRPPPMGPATGSTIFGIAENRGLYDQDGTPDADVSLHRPMLDSAGAEGGRCVYKHPTGDWNRDRAAALKGAPSAPGGRPLVRFVDLTGLQAWRRRRARGGGPVLLPHASGKGGACHLLRSVLTCDGGSGRSRGGHSASPWWERYGGGEGPTTDQVVAILMSGHAGRGRGEDGGNDDSHRSDLELSELEDLMNFRTGDASPSYYLHSVSMLSVPWGQGGEGANLTEVLQLPGGPDLGNMNTTLLVYRHLPPRDILSSRSPVDGTSCVKKGKSPYFFIETYQAPREDEADGRLPPVQHRMVSPPYQAHGDIYPRLLDAILTEENLRAITEEALSIPLWTAWPEKSHYSSPEDEDVQDRQNSPYPATWTVFPLCHTFPADNLANRHMIGKTCAFAPRTSALLRDLGPALRTALFSRLEPKTTLSAHTGWEDLANHVLRVHIPLVVPDGDQNDGLCGTWVDGCVETHRRGEVVCFDDSKVHRAFNYTGGERIVLIIDLARPDSFPIGTATGGHTEELDKFIKEVA